MTTLPGSTVALKTVCHLNSIELVQATLTGMPDAVPVRGPRPDASWHHFDARGHFHTFAADGTLPTLERRTVQDDPDPEDDFGYAYLPVRTWFECRICAAEVNPRFLPDSEFCTPMRLLGVRYTVEGCGPATLLDLVGQRAVFTTLTQFGIGRVDLPGTIELANDGPNLVCVRIELEFLADRASAATGKRDEPVHRGQVAPGEFSRAVAAGAAALHPTEFAHLAADRVVRAALPHLGLDIPGERS